MLAKDIMQLCHGSLSPGDPLSSAIQLFQKLKVGALPVFNDKNKLVGAVTPESIMFSAAFNLQSSVEGFLVEAGLVKDTVSVEKLHAGGDCRVFVVKGKNFFGIITKNMIDQYMSKKLANKNTLLQNILESIHYAIISIDSGEKVTYLNRPAENILRTSKASAIGRHISKVVTSSGFLDVLRRGISQINYEHTTKYFNSTKSFISHRTPIFEDKKVVGAVSIFQSIDELDSISHKLKTFEQLNKELEALIEASYDGILIANPDNIILRANKAYWRLNGENNATIVTAPDKARLSGIQKKLVADVIAKKEIVNSAINTSHSQLLLTGTPVWDSEGNLFRILVNIRDLTELNSLRMQLARSHELALRYHEEVSNLKEKILKREGLVIHSLPMRRILDLALRVAQVDSTILILGESGVGKGVLARIIHENSRRNKNPYVEINCGAIPEGLLESELFGYEAGSFTGSNKKGHIGLFEVANNGTILLDEIGDLPLPLQVKLLKAIQDKEIYRIGGSRPIQINVRILAATNKDLKNMVEKGLFREDLYFRLNVIPLTVPPLRDRKDEIISLAETFVSKFNKAYGMKKELSQEVIDYFLDYNWPGNVRELENVVERILVTSPHKKVTLYDFPLQFKKEPEGINPILVNNLIPLKRAIAEVERQLIIKAVKECGSTHKAAKALDVNQSTIVRKIQKYNHT